MPARSTQCYGLQLPGQFRRLAATLPGDCAEASGLLCLFWARASFLLAQLWCQHLVVCAECAGGLRML